MTSLGIAGYDRAVEVRRDRFGVVCSAWDTDAGRAVDVRLLRVSALDDAGREELILRLDALTTLPVHPNLTAVLAVGVNDAGRGYVVSAAEPDGTLADRVAERGGLPWQRVARLGAAVAAGLETAHAAGVLHGGIRGECIQLSALDLPRLADLGVAQVISLLDPREGGGRERLSAEADVEALAASLGASIRGGAPEALVAALEGAAGGETPVSAAALGEGLAAVLAAPAPAGEGEDAAGEDGPMPQRPPLLSTRGGRLAVAAGAVVLTLGGMVLAPRLAGDVVRVSGPAAPVDESLRMVSVDPSRWAPDSRWNRAGPAVSAGRSCGGDVGSFVYSFEAPRVPGSAYVVGAWLSSNVARLTASPDAFSDVALVVNGARYPVHPAGAVSARGQYFEWRVSGSDVHASGSNSMEYAVDAAAVHRHGLCVHFGPTGLESAQQITVRSVG